MGTGANVSKTNAYAAVSAPAGAGVSKANAYAVVVAAAAIGLNLSKTNAYAAVSSPAGVSVSKVNAYAVLAPMGTFNGWTIIPTPPWPSPQSIGYTAIDTVGVSVSPFTGQTQLQNWCASWMELSISMPPMPNRLVQQWLAFLLALQGTDNVFQLGDPLMATPLGSGAGTPVVNGGVQTGYSLVTRGWTANAAGVLLPGDYLQIGYRLYRNLTVLNADASGNAIASIWPQIRESPVDAPRLSSPIRSGFCA
jgi:hypothetical protein